MNQESRGDFKIGEISTNAWWFSQIEGNQNWFPGGVFILFLGPVSCVAPAAAWFTTAMGLMQLDGSPLFPKKLIVTPPGHKDSDYKSRFYATIESTYADGKNNMPTGLRQALGNPECVFEESDCANVLTRITIRDIGESHIAIRHGWRWYQNDCSKRPESQPNPADGRL
jgi:hypothetical protein